MYYWLAGFILSLFGIGFVCGILEYESLRGRIEWGLRFAFGGLVTLVLGGLMIFGFHSIAYGTQDEPACECRHG